MKTHLLQRVVNETPRVAVHCLFLS